jgi:hypothetical protein
MNIESGQMDLPYSVTATLLAPVHTHHHASHAPPTAARIRDVRGIDYAS